MGKKEGGGWSHILCNGEAAVQYGMRWGVPMLVHPSPQQLGRWDSRQAHLASGGWVVGVQSFLGRHTNGVAATSRRCVGPAHLEGIDDARRCVYDAPNGLLAHWIRVYARSKTADHKVLVDYIGAALRERVDGVAYDDDGVSTYGLPVYGPAGVHCVESPFETYGLKVYTKGVPGPGKAVHTDDRLGRHLAFVAMHAVMSHPNVAWDHRLKAAGLWAARWAGPCMEAQRLCAPVLVRAGMRIEQKPLYHGGTRTTNIRCPDIRGAHTVSIWYQSDPYQGIWYSRIRPGIDLQEAAQYDDTFSGTRNIVTALHTPPARTPQAR